MRAIFSLFLTATCLLAAEAPRVDKVEPPNWWANSSVNPVRVLVRRLASRAGVAAQAVEAGRPRPGRPIPSGRASGGRTMAGRPGKW
jgi:hypothetical protein